VTQNTDCTKAVLVSKCHAVLRYRVNVAEVQPAELHCVHLRTINVQGVHKSSLIHLIYFVTFCTAENSNMRRSVQNKTSAAK
jgi:hypothetical protein